MGLKLCSKVYHHFLIFLLGDCQDSLRFHVKMLLTFHVDLTYKA